MNLPRYPKYKPSGVDWLGEVPEGWEVLALQRIAETIQTGPFGSMLHQSDYVDDGIPLINPLHIVEGELRPESSFSVTEEMALKLSRYALRRGDIVFARRGEIGRCGIVNNELGWLCGTGSLVVRLSGGEPRYVATVCRSNGFAQRLELNAVGTTMLNINPAILGRMLLPVPPLPEQHAIADFLDRETGRIDALIAKQGELIDRLKEKRAALITRAVTHGLDPAAKLKDSGVEWLGMVPEGWEVVPLGYLVKIAGGATPDKSNAEFWQGDIPWVSPKDMKQPQLADAEDHITSEALRTSPLSMVPIGSVLIVVRGMILVHSFPVALSTAPLTINQDMKALTCCSDLINQFLFLVLCGAEKVFVSAADESAHGTRKLETATIRHFCVPLPPLPEQRAIADYLDRETGKLDRLTERITTAIERLKEYRAALITAAVTGKIDVREEAAKETT